MQANAQECETARDAETQAQTTTAAAKLQPTLRKFAASRDDNDDDGVVCASSSIAYAQSTARQQLGLSVALQSFVESVDFLVRIRSPYSLALRELRARAESFDLLRVCLCVCNVCRYYCYLFFMLEKLYKLCAISK